VDPLVVDDSSPKTLSTKEVARPYNPLSASSGDSITLLVKRYGQDAQMGSKLHGLKAGDTVEIKGPNRQWGIPQVSSVKHYGLIAGGTGITPLIQAAEGILKSDPEAKVTLITFNKTSSDVLLRITAHILEKEHPSRFKVVDYVEDNKHIHTDKLGRPSKETLKETLPSPFAHGGMVKILVCGPKDMTAAVAGPKTPDFKQGEIGGMLKELGYKKSQIFKL
jgi:cytochrome-b5 reductase